jgi:OOP family OmpA-OmpF porin
MIRRSLSVARPVPHAPHPYRDRGLLRLIRHIIVGSCLGASIPSAAFAATWADGRSTPHLLDLVVIDRTGEPRWLFGAEDVAGDGLGTFLPPERAIDLRSAYARPDRNRLWLRAYVSSDAVPDDDLRVFFFFDTDAQRNTGGSAVAPAIDAAFTRDDSGGGYDVVIGMQPGTALGGVWRWNSDDMAFAEDEVAPLAAVAESGVDADPLRLFAGEHGYLQVSLDARALDIQPSCAARLLVRAATASGQADLDVGVLAPCVSLDADRNQVPDLLEVEDARCDSDDQCPASGLCVSGRCLFPSYCRDNPDCASGERCDASGICRAQGGASCSGDACSGGLVCDDASECQACATDASCANGQRCAASGRCVDENSRSGAVAGSDIVLDPGQEIQGGAGSCALGVSAPGRWRSPLWLGALALLGLSRRGRRRGPGAWGGLVLAASFLTSPDSRAQVDAERLKPAVTHDGWVDAEGSAVRHPDDPWELGVVMNYAYHPLIIADADEAVVAALVAGRLGLEGIASVSLSERFALGLALPVFLQHGDASPSAAGVGDLRLVPKLELSDDVSDGVGLALAAELRAPTHSGDFSGGAHGFTVWPKLIADHRYPGGLRIGANVGVIVREDRRFLNVSSGDEFAYAAAVSYRFGGLSGRTEAGVELNGAVNLRHAGDEEVALEALGFLRHVLSPEWQVEGGVGAGVLEGYGVPTWRVFIGATFTPTSHDRDDDGVADSKDQCAEFAEDRDGVQDADGCPEEDTDSDHDGVADDDDRCPTSKETINGIQDDDGCPDAGDRRVLFDNGEFVVLDTIRFNTGSSEIHPGAHALLDQVALTLRASPEIEHIRIEGHTDDTGPREVNMMLSEQRALAVKHYLVQRGVSPRRLTLKSYGPDRPRAAGSDSRARASNRRVEFIVE